jgi:hypothetical protein
VPGLHRTRRRRVSVRCSAPLYQRANRQTFHGQRMRPLLKGGSGDPGDVPDIQPAHRQGIIVRRSGRRGHRSSYPLGPRGSGRGCHGHALQSLRLIGRGIGSAGRAGKAAPGELKSLRRSRISRCLAMSRSPRRTRFASRGRSASRCFTHSQPILDGSRRGSPDAVHHISREPGLPVGRCHRAT